MTTTEADAQSWLERQADRFMETREFTSDVVPGVHRLVCEVILDAEDLRDARRYERFEPKPLTFWCYWYSLKLTTTRGPSRGTSQSLRICRFPGDRHHARLRYRPWQPTRSCRDRGR